MKAVLLALVVALALLGVSAAVSQAPQNHQFQTPKGTVVVTVQHGPPAQPQQQPQQQEASEESSAEASSEESSSEASSPSEESSSEESSSTVGTGDLSRYTLPPEPEAAKGYRSLSCGNDDPCNEQQQQQEQVQQPCTENCEAQEAASNLAAGRVVMSQPLGDASGANGYAPAPGTRTSGAAVDTSSWVVAPQTGLDANTAMGGLPSNMVAAAAAAPVEGIAVGEPHPQAPSCGCSVCPCKYVSPAEKRAQRLAQLEAQEKAERDQEKSKLAVTMRAHQSNLEKIEQMSRALRWQYTQLRRQHNLLRAHISANKAVYNQLGGDNEYRGTDLDIEATPNTYETLDDIPSADKIRVNDNEKERVTDATNAHHAHQTSLLKKLHASVSKTVTDIAGESSESSTPAGAAKAAPQAKAESGRAAADAAIAAAEAAK